MNNTGKTGQPLMYEIGQLVKNWNRFLKNQLFIGMNSIKVIFIRR